MTHSVGLQPSQPLESKPVATEQAELVALIHLLRRRRHWLVGTVAVAVAAGLLYCFLTPPVYRASADILMLSSQASPLGGLAGLAGVSPTPVARGMSVETATRVLESWTLQAQALALLQAHPQFFRDCTLGRRGLKTIVDIPPEVAETFREGATVASISEQQQAMLKELRIRQVGTSNVLRVFTLSPDLPAACDFVNALCAAYLLWQQQSKRFSAELALEQLRRQLADARRRLAEAEDRLEEFQRTHRLVDATAQAQDLISRLGKLQDQVATLEAGLVAQRAQDRYMEQQIEKTQPVQVSATVVAANPLVQQMKKTLFDLYTQRAELLQEYTEESQKVKAIDQQIEEVKQKLAETVETIVSSQTESPNPLRNNLIAQYAQGRAATIALEVRLPVVKRMLKQVERAVENLPPESRQLAALKREVQIQQQRYISLRQQVQAQESAREQLVADEVILASAQILPWLEQKPVRPRKVLTMLLALMFGLLLGVMLAVFADQLDETYPTLDVAEAESGLALLGVLPVFPDGRMPLLTEQSGPVELRRAMVSICTAMQLSRPEPPNRVIAITGTRRGEGRSSVTCNLAITAARMGRNVLLIDCDLDHPQVLELFGARPRGALCDIVAGSAAPEDVEVQPIEGLALHVMTMGVEAASFAEWIGTPRVPEVLDDLRKRHDVIFLDLAPCQETNEVAWLASLADATVLLMVPKFSRRADMIRAQALLVRSGARLVGMIANRAAAADWRDREPPRGSLAGRAGGGRQ